MRRHASRSPASHPPLAARGRGGGCGQAARCDGRHHAHDRVVLGDCDDARDVVADMDGALAAVLATALTAGAALAAHRPFGAYGVAIAALGGAKVCAAGSGLSVQHNVLTQAGRTCLTGGRGDERTKTRVNVLRGVAAGGAAFGARTTVGAAGLCAAALWWVASAGSGVGVRIRDVVGGIDVDFKPIMHVTDLGEADVSSPFALGALMGGVWMLSLIHI